MDAHFADKTVFAGVRWENSAITCIDEAIEPVSNALIFAKEDYDADLLSQINAFIAKARANGTLDRLSEKWFSDAEPDEHPDYTYGGESYDPLETENDLSLMLAKKATENILYSYDPEQKLTNRVDAQIY